MWYLAHSTGGQRTMFWGCGIAGNFDQAAFASTWAESLRASVRCPVAVASSS